MKPFKYLRPTTLQEAREGLAGWSGNVHLLAGGTDLTVGLRHGHFAADVVMDVKRINELRPYIQQSDGALLMSGCVAMTTIGNHSVVKAKYAALAEAAAVVGSLQIRNRATLIGNICNASPAADTVPVLAVFGAYVDIVGPDGARSLTVADFIKGNRKIALNSGELVTGVRLPISEGPIGSAFGRITRRRGVDLATVNLACHVDDVGQMTFAFGAASPRPLVVVDKEGVLGNPRSNDKEVDAAIEQLVAHARPISDVRATETYRLAMLKILAKRARQTALVRLEEARLHG